MAKADRGREKGREKGQQGGPEQGRTSGRDDEKGQVTQGASKAGSSAERGERVAKRLSRAGVASRRDAERMIEAGRVAVNGTVLDRPAVLVAESDIVTVDGRPIEETEPPRLFRFHKPKGVVTTARDERGRSTIYDVLPEDAPRLMPVGRLDLSSEGLLLLTNDGGLKRRLELPSVGWLRKYRVRVHGEPTEARLRPLIDGLTLDGEHFQPMLVAIDRQQGSNAWLTVGLREGRNREIRRAFEALGFPVSRLIRTAFGPFRLGSLAVGALAEAPTKPLDHHLAADAPTPAVRERSAPAKTRRPPSKPAAKSRP